MEYAKIGKKCEVSLDDKTLSVLGSIGEWVKIFSEEEGAFITATTSLAKSFNTLSISIDNLAEAINNQDLVWKVNKRFADRAKEKRENKKEV